MVAKRIRRWKIREVVNKYNTEVNKDERTLEDKNKDICRFFLYKVG